MQQVLDPDSVGHGDLRSGTAPWWARFARPRRHPVTQSFNCDVLVVGGGITGSLTAQHLTALGYKVCVIDREPAGFGSTAASTAMLMWEIDRSVAALTRLYGFTRAARIYHQSLAAVAGLKDLIATLALDCGFRDRSGLYLAGGEIGAPELAAEHALRQRARLPGTLLDHATLQRAFGIGREAAIVSEGSADADPLRLSHALLEHAAAHGAQLYEAEATDYESASGRVAVGLAGGREIGARAVVLATGYAIPSFVRSDIHEVISSWAFATPPQEPQNLWRDGALIWEASESYLYARTTTDNRIVLGGEDDAEAIEPQDREARTPQKIATLLDKLRHLWPAAQARADFVWSGAFSQTADGLPLIGPVAGSPGIYAAYGYGGNGITFSYLASRMIARMIAGERDDGFDAYAIDRPAP